MTRSPRRLSKHVREAVGEHVRDLPIQAARLAMFGVGRALLLGDRVAKDYKELRGSGPGPVLNRLRGDVRNLAGKAAGRVAERVVGSPESAPPVPTVPTTPAAETVAETPVARPPVKVNRSLAADSEIAVGKPAPSRNGTGPSPVSGIAPEPVAEPAPALEAEPVAKADRLAKPQPATKPKRAPKPTPIEPAPKAAAEEKITSESLPVPNYDQATLPSLRGRLRALSAEQVGLLRAYERQNAARPDVLRMYENRIAKLNEMH